jgi:hypothetical protein
LFEFWRIAAARRPGFPLQSFLRLGRKKGFPLQSWLHGRAAILSSGLRPAPCAPRGWSRFCSAKSLLAHATWAFRMLNRPYYPNPLVTIDTTGKKSNRQVEKVEEVKEVF